MARFFISYSHGSQDDQALARWLHERLGEEGHTVFLDERMRLGTKWKDEIPRTIEESDVFIVLVSEDSVQSDMVQEEVLIAREHERKQGCRLIAPVRVKFSEGDLGYVLGAYLRSYQWFNWESDDDSSTLLDELIGMAGDAPVPREEDAGPTPRQPAPAPVVHLNAVRAPGGGMRPDDPLYLERTADAEALARVGRTGETTVLLGSRQTGKTSLLNRCLAACRQHNKHVAAVDFSLFNKSQFLNLGDLLRELARSFVRELRRKVSVDEIDAPNDMTWFLEDHILQAVGRPMTLVIDEVDRVFEESYRSDFFGMIRGWHNARGKVGSPWKDVDLLLAISTEPHLLMVDHYQSPFNVSPPIRLPWFVQLGSDLE